MNPDSTSRTLILSRKIKGFRPLILGLFLTVAYVPQSLANGILIHPEALSHIPQNQRILVDTRPAWKFLLGHIPGAVNLDNWKAFTRKQDQVKGMLIDDKNFIANKLAPLGVSPDKIIVIYGETDDPWRTDGRFFWMFEYYGFKKVALLDGGYSHWKRTGGNIERGRQKPTPQPPSALDTVNLDYQIIADKILINKVFLSDKYKIIDNRTLKEFEGATPYGSARAGHIPHAIHIHWPAFFNADGTLKTASALQSLLHQNNIRPDQEIIVYCTGGVRSAMAYFVFRYLGFKVRNYDGSWWDWSQSTYPVELNG